MTVEQAANPDVVRSERRGAVLILTLNRPHRLNAWSDAMEQRCFDLLDAADADPDVRAVVLTGAGRGFCAGADMDDLDLAADARTAPDELPRPKTHPLGFRKPLIAAINGPAAGVGLVQALCADLRFCAPEAKLTTSFARRGLIAEYGISWLLGRLVGPSRALDLLLSARVVLGNEAATMGLVDHVTDTPLERAVEYADDLARHCSPSSMAVIKRQIWDDLAQPYAAASSRADHLLRESFARPDVAEGVTSFQERRPPQFPPLLPPTK